MNPTDPLAQLHPLREPAAIGWWPPAPGWWVLALLLLVAATALVFLLWQRRRRNRYRVQGLAQLRALRDQYRASGDAARCGAGVNALLKTLALHAYPNSGIAALHGEQWENFLARTGGAGLAFTGITATHYQPEADSAAVERLCRAAEDWIRRHRGAA